MPDDDPNGAGLNAGALRLVLGAWIAAVIRLVAVHGAARQAGGAFAFAILGGFGLTAVLHGNYVVTSVAVALAIAATAWTILGLRSVLGMAGGVDTVLLILLGNPLSGLAAPPELLAAGSGTLGQLLPPRGGWQPPTVHRVLRR